MKVAHKWKKGKVLQIVEPWHQTEEVEIIKYVDVPCILPVKNSACFPVDCLVASKDRWMEPERGRMDGKVIKRTISYVWLDQFPVHLQSGLDG